MRGMTLIVRTTASLLIGFIVLFGCYVVLTGHLSPGGGFSGGVILAAGVVLVILAFGAGSIRKRLGHNVAVLWESLGAIGFLAVALLGFVAGGFFGHFIPSISGFRLFTGGSMVLSNVAIGIKVGAGLFGAFLMLAVFRASETGGNKDKGGG